MFGIDPLTAGTLMVLAAGGNVCDMAKATEINVVPVTQEVKFVTDMTLAEMQKQNIDTINPHSFNGLSVTQGFAMGEISIKASVSLDGVQVRGQPAACLWYKEINIGFEVNPNIYIAKEVYRDLCMRRAVSDHEMKHVNTDKRVINKFAQHIGRMLYDELKARGFVAGPIALEDVEAVSDRMKNTVLQLVEREQKRFEIERMDMQALVDTKEEYERVAAQCPRFKVTPDMLE
jgi:hypothetical protein